MKFLFLLCLLSLPWRFLQGEEGVDMEVGGLEEVDQAMDDTSDSDALGGGRLDALLTAIDNGREHDRRAAIWQARRHPQSKRLVENLIQCVQEKEPEFASIAAVALGHMKAKPAVPALRAALNHSSPWVRESAAYALGLVGDPSALNDLAERRPHSPSLSQWIYQDALERLEGRPGGPSARRKSLRGATIYYLGAEGSSLRPGWKDLIRRYDLQVDGVSPPPLNVVMRYFGGPPDTREFYRRLEDKDGNPQVDVVVISGLLAYEFPAYLRWKLFQFVRRGGILIVLGNTPFVRGEIRTVENRVVHFFAMPAELWHDCLPQKLDREFKPLLAGFGGAFRNTLRSGMRDFGHGRTLLLANAVAPELPLVGLDQSESHLDHRDKNWGRGEMGVERLENIFLYALEGEEPFQALLDLHGGPEKILAGNSASFSLNLFSSTGSSGELEIQVWLGKRMVAAKKFPAELGEKKLLAMQPDIPLPWTLQDGLYEARMTFRTPEGQSSSSWSFNVFSPLRLSWQMEDSYEKAGGELAGRAEVENQRKEALQDLHLVLDVADAHGRTLQRHQQATPLMPGRNGPFELRLQARDYRIGSYHLILKLVQGDTVLQSSTRLLHRCGPFRFQQDLVYVPWNTAALPTEERMRDLLLESGFNGIGSLEAFPGWYNWGVNGPLARCTASWPGELAEQTVGPRGMTMVQLGSYMRHRLPGYSIMDPWDESEIEMVVSARGEDLGPTASVLYRNWLKSRYFSLDALNQSWSKNYQIQTSPGKDSWLNWAMPGKTRIPPPREWQGDLTSWNQIWAWRGAPTDWGHYANSLWGELIFSECHRQFRKTNRNHYWHWSDAFHTRLYVGNRPGQLNWECHKSRAQFGSRPSTIMLHFYYSIKDKRPEAVRRSHWDGLAGSGRHFINWTPSLEELHGLEGDTSIWYPDYTLRPHGQALADSIRRVRSKEQVLLDAQNYLSPEVAFLYGGSVAPRELFDALLFAGINPESLQIGSLRSERMPLDSFRAIFVCGDLNLPESWQKRLAEWKEKGGKVFHPKDFIFSYEGDRIESPGFSAYQVGILNALEQCGVKPPVMVLDDNGLPETSVEPVLLETEDRSQRYLLAATDLSLEGSQAFGGLENHSFREKVVVTQGWSEGVKFSVTGKAGKYQLWARVKVSEPFDARVTVDGKPGLPLVVYRQPRSALWAERGVGETRWVAGPAFELSEGEHLLQIEPQKGRAEIFSIWVVDELLAEPTMICRDAGIKEVYDVYNDRLIPRQEGGGWRMRAKASDGEIYGLITEDLGAVEVEPLWLPGATDRLLQLKISIRRSDGSLSDCRHAVNIRVRDAAGKEIEGLFTKASVRGWKVVTLYPAQEDPPLPWTLEVKDISSGRAGEARVTAAASKAFDELMPLPPLELRAEPLQPFEGDVHLASFGVTLINRQEKPVQGDVKIEMAPELLWEGRPQVRVEVGGKDQKTFEWVAVLGRQQAIALMDRPPRAWLTLSDGKVLETAFDDVWVRRWEKTPPRLTNLAAAEVPVDIQTFLDRPVKGNLELGISPHWEIVEPLQTEISLPPRKAESLITRLAFKARLKPFSKVSPEVLQMPLRLNLGDRVYDAGYRLVEMENRRTWYTALPPLEVVGVMDEFKPEIPSGPVDAREAKLWGLEWKLQERDTLIDFEVNVGQRIFAVTNVCFPKEGEVSVRIRGDEKVDVWLAGETMLPRKAGTETPAVGETKVGGGLEEGAQGEEAEPAELKGMAWMRVPAGQWLPLVLRYYRQTSYPVTDLVFLDAEGNVLWEAEFRVGLAF